MPEILERRRRGQMQVGWGRSPDQAPVAGRQERRPLVRGGRGGWQRAQPGRQQAAAGGQAGCGGVPGVEGGHTGK